MDIQVNDQRGGHPYEYPRPITIYLDIHMDIGASIRVGLSVLRTVRQG